MTRTDRVGAVVRGVLLVLRLFDVLDEFAVEAVAVVLVLADQRLHDEPQTPVTRTTDT